MKSQVLHTVWCNTSSQAEGEIWSIDPARGSERVARTKSLECWTVKLLFYLLRIQPHSDANHQTVNGGRLLQNLLEQSMAQIKTIDIQIPWRDQTNRALCMHTCRNWNTFIPPCRLAFCRELIMVKIVAVFGATGAQGGGVASAVLQAKEKFAVRAITRNPDSDKAAALRGRGCEVVKCDMDDDTSVRNAVKGCYGVYLVTNYWEHFSMEKEIAQGKRVTDICKEVGVRHLVYSGLENVHKAIGIPCGE